QIGRSGRTSTTAILAPHLHFELWYGSYPSGAYLDPALFFPVISNDASENGPTPSTLRSPVLRFAAQLDPANEPQQAGLAGTLLGINTSTLASELSLDETTTTTVCPYGSNAPIPPSAYKVVKMGAPGAATTIAWDLGACIYPSLVDTSTPSKPVCNAANPSVKLTFGLTSWRRSFAGSWL